LVISFIGISFIRILGYFLPSKNHFVLRFIVHNERIFKKVYTIKKIKYKKISQESFAGEGTSPLP
jgi:hypothetical protein